MKKLTLDALTITTFATEDQVTHAAKWPCTGCVSGCGILPPADKA